MGVTYSKLIEHWIFSNLAHYLSPCDQKLYRCELSRYWMGEDMLGLHVYYHSNCSLSDHIEEGPFIVAADLRRRFLELDDTPTFNSFDWSAFTYFLPFTYRIDDDQFWCRSAICWSHHPHPIAIKTVKCFFSRS